MYGLALCCVYNSSGAIDSSSVCIIISIVIIMTIFVVLLLSLLLLLLFLLTAGTVLVNTFPLDIFSNSIPGQVETPRKIHLDNTSELHLTHLYTLHNLGPSPFPHGQLTIRLPHTPLVWLNNVQVCIVTVTRFSALTNWVVGGM